MFKRIYSISVCMTLYGPPSIGGIYYGLLPSVCLFVHPVHTHKSRRKDLRNFKFDVNIPCWTCICEHHIRAERSVSEISNWQHFVDNRQNRISWRPSLPGAGGGTAVRELTRGLATLPQRWIQEPLLVRDRDGRPPRGPSGSVMRWDYLHKAQEDSVYFSLVWFVYVAMCSPRSYQYIYSIRLSK